MGLGARENGLLFLVARLKSEIEKFTDSAKNTPIGENRIRGQPKNTGT